MQDGTTRYPASRKTANFGTQKKFHCIAFGLVALETVGGCVLYAQHREYTTAGGACQGLESILARFLQALAAPASRQHPGRVIIPVQIFPAEMGLYGAAVTFAQN